MASITSGIALQMDYTGLNAVGSSINLRENAELEYVTGTRTNVYYNFINYSATLTTDATYNNGNPDTVSGYHIESVNGELDVTGISYATWLRTNIPLNDLLSIDRFNGNDSITGSGSSDSILGYDGNDTLFGENNDDTINGNSGNDNVDGGSGHDSLRGGKDIDTIFGDGDSDSVYGDLANDTVHGGSGEDMVRGGKGDDYIYGDEGNDILYGDLGNDTLDGGSGTDLFIFAAGSGADVIANFSKNSDTLQIAGGVGSVSYTVSDSIISTAGGGSITLLGITQSDFADMNIISV